MSFSKRHIQAKMEPCRNKEKFRDIFHHYSWFQTPWRFIHFCIGLVYSTLTLLFWMEEPTDSDIVRYIMGTALTLIMKRETTETKNMVYHLDIRNCKLKVLTGDVKSLQITFTIPKHGQPRIDSFVFNGEEVSERQGMLSVLVTFYQLTIHGKTHMFSGDLTEYIVVEGLDALKPSTYSSVPLHHALLTNVMSGTPHKRGWYNRLIGHIYSYPIHFESFVEEMHSMDSMRGHQLVGDRRNLPQYVRYLMKTREILKQVMAKNDIPSNLREGLFNHCIVHDLDHLNQWNNTKNLRFGFIAQGRKPTAYETFQQLMITYMIVKPHVNPLMTIKHRHIKLPFYQDLYTNMKTLDAEFGFDVADHLTAGASY